MEIWDLLGSIMEAVPLSGRIEAAFFFLLWWLKYECCMG